MMEVNSQPFKDIMMHLLAQYTNNALLLIAKDQEDARKGKQEEPISQTEPLVIEPLIKDAPDIDQ